MSQTSYATFQPIAFAGLKYDCDDDDINTAVNAEASAEIPFGVFVTKGGSVGDQGAILPAANGSVAVLGCVVHSHAYSKGAEGELGTSGLKPKTVLNVMPRGRIWVAVAGATAVGDAVHVVYAGSRQKGSVANATTTNETFLLNHARFITSTSGAGFAAIDFDILGGNTAGATS